MKSIVLLALLAGCATVPAGHRAVVTVGGKVTDVLDEGIHWGASYWLNPLLDITTLTIQVQASEFEASASSRDLQTVTTEVTVNWKRGEDQVQKHYEEYPDILRRVIAPAVQESLKAITAQYTAEQMITSRPDVKAAMEGILKERLQPVGVDVLAISITDFRFSAKFDDAIEAKMEAEQRALKAERELQRIEIEAKQAIAAAEGQKQAMILAAQGEAESIRIQGDALRQNPSVLELRRIEKWNGKLPDVTSGQGVSMMKVIE